MKKHHLFVFYCTLLVPIGALIGAGVGSAQGMQVLATIVGSGAGICASYLLMRFSQSSQTT